MPKHTAQPSAPVVFEPEFIAGVKSIFEEKIVFNQVLGLKIDALTPDSAAAHIPMRPELIGHYAHHRMHGGVISAGLDAMGGLAVMCAIGARHMDETPLQRLLRFAKLGTIDLRVDYLRPGRGQRFTATAVLLRSGNKVAVVRSELHSEDGTLVAVGTGTYLTG